MDEKQRKLERIEANLSAQGKTLGDLWQQVKTMEDLGITHAQIETIGQAVDGFAEAFETALTAVQAG